LKLKVFESNEFGQVRIVEKNEEPWFVARDVCEVLGLNASEAIRGRKDRDFNDGLEEDEFRDDIDIVDTIGRTVKTLVINESGLYNLVFKSRKPEAKKFRKWVTSEVLPSIRKTGQYSAIDVTQLTPELQMFKKIFDSVASQQLKVTQLESKVEVMQSNLLQEHKDDWRNYINKVLKAIGYKTGNYNFVRNESYKELEKRANCKLDVRLGNLKARALNQGMAPSKVNNLNKLDILEDEPRLREIYLGIIREYAIKYGIGVE
jgi:prophage antirepressor-like protein